MPDRVKVAIIDSGVYVSHPVFAGESVRVINLDGKADVGNEIYGHGSAVYGIIRKAACADILNVQVNGIECGVSAERLISALKYILDNEPDIELINLSLGINALEEYDELMSLCNALYERGTLIIAAFDNMQCMSYPAAFENVIGVISDDRCRMPGDFIYVDDTAVNICAKGGLQRTVWSKPEYLFSRGSSFACAHVTKKAAELISAGIRGRDAILESFKSISIDQICVEKNVKGTNGCPFTISKAALFPFNKEMHSLIRFGGTLPFEIDSVYDVRFSGRIGADTANLVNAPDAVSRKIKNIDDINFDGFDTLILGHTAELRSYMNDDWLNDLVDQVLERGKNIYSFDAVETKCGAQGRIFYPSVTEDNLPPNRFGMLYKVSKPVVGVFGTSSRQGKFSLQVQLRDHFTARGYKVGQIGTEPTSLLFGMDHVFPMGYGSTVYLSEYDSIRYLNNAVNGMCSEGADIIIVGCQSGSVSYDIGNMNQTNLAQYAFLCGTQPDAVVLCANPFDQPEYVKRTICFLEAAVACEVLAVVLFPVDMSIHPGIGFNRTNYLSDSAYEAKANELCRVTGKKIYRLGDKSDIGKLADQIEDYFS